MVKKDYKRDELFTDFGKATLRNRYLLEGEDFQELFKRVATAYCKDQKFAQRMYDYMSKHWFMPSTPILSNAGTSRGLPISCYLNDVRDSLDSISAKWEEDTWIGAKGGGIGTCWSSVRSVGEPVRKRGGSSGVIPFIRVLDSLTLAISQGSLRRGSAACYLHVRHPEIEEFLELRKPSGDFNRKSLNLHHGVVISDSFMKAVDENKSWELISPMTSRVLKEVNARQLFQSILATRVATGEPYLIFEDNINNARPAHHQKLDLRVKQSNLCAEIVLPTGVDHKGVDRTAVCCLGSVNLEYYDAWKYNPLFIKDCLRFLDYVLSDFIKTAENTKGLGAAAYSARVERSIGLGVMGFHSYLQSKSLAFESLSAQLVNTEIFKHIRHKADEANVTLAEELGVCEDAKDAGELRRFSYMLAIAPTASISIVAGGTSPCVEPWNSNIFTQKTLSGSFEVRNNHLKNLLASKNKDTDHTWLDIIEHGGSVQQLDFLTSAEKAIYKTAFEVDQRWVIKLASERAGFIDQSQSINLFLDGTVSKWELLMLHVTAWKKGLKSLYYLRSRSVQRVGFAGSVEDDNKMSRDYVVARGVDKLDFDECLSCQ